MVQVVTSRSCIVGLNAKLCPTSTGVRHSFALNHLIAIYPIIYNTEWVIRKKYSACTFCTTPITDYITGNSLNFIKFKTVHTGYNSIELEDVDTDWGVLVAESWEGNHTVLTLSTKMNLGYSIDSLLHPRSRAQGHHHTPPPLLRATSFVNELFFINIYI